MSDIDRDWCRVSSVMQGASLWHRWRVLMNWCSEAPETHVRNERLRKSLAYVNELEMRSARLQHSGPRCKTCEAPMPKRVGRPRELCDRCMAQYELMKQRVAGAPYGDQRPKDRRS